MNFAEEELGSYDDGFGDTPTSSKGKGKANASSRRTRIESDDEDDRHAAARGPGRFATQITAATKADPSFSVLPLSPNAQMYGTARRLTAASRV